MALILDGSLLDPLPVITSAQACDSAYVLRTLTATFPRQGIYCLADLLLPMQFLRQQGAGPRYCKWTPAERERRSGQTRGCGAPLGI